MLILLLIIYNIFKILVIKMALIDSILSDVFIYFTNIAHQSYIVYFYVIDSKLQHAFQSPVSDKNGYKQIFRDFRLYLQFKLCFER